MGKLSEFNITFQSNFNGSAIYHPGDPISGSVIAVLTDSIELKGNLLNNFLFVLYYCLIILSS